MMTKGDGLDGGSRKVRMRNLTSRAKDEDGYWGTTSQGHSERL